MSNKNYANLAIAIASAALILQLVRLYLLLAG